MVWLSYVGAATDAVSWSSLDQRFNRTPDEIGTQVFSRIALGSRSPPPDLVAQVDRDPATAGTKDTFEGVLWAVLSDPPPTVWLASQLATDQLSKAGLRRASLSEARLLSGMFAMSGAALTVHLLVQMLNQADPVMALGILVTLHREADLAFCQEMTGPLLQAIDARADRFLLAHLGEEGWSNYYQLLLNAVRHAPRPRQSAEHWPVLDPERLILPIVPETYIVEMSVESLSELLKSPGEGSSSARERESGS